MFKTLILAFHLGSAWQGFSFGKRKYIPNAYTQEDDVTSRYSWQVCVLKVSLNTVNGFQLFRMAPTAVRCPVVFSG